MALIPGQQQTLSSTANGALVGRYDTLALSNGAVVTATADGFGPVTLFLQEGPDAQRQSLGTLPGLSNQGIFLFELPDGGFGVVYNSPEDDRGGDDNLTYARFDGTGAQVGTPQVLATGDVANFSAVGSGAGFVVSYQDRNAGAPQENVTAFHATDGSLREKVGFDDLGEGLTSPQALANGDVLLTWSGRVLVGSRFVERDFGQVWSADGTAQGTPVQLPTDDGGVLWVAHPDGGLVRVTLGSETVFQPTTGTEWYVEMQAYGTDLQPVGAASRAVIGREFDPGELSATIGENGVVAIAFTDSRREGTTLNTDIQLMAAALDGTVLFGPERVNEIVAGRQLSPEVQYLPDGDVLVAHLDEEFVSLGYQDAVQGLVAASPDTLVIGDETDETYRGGPGNDALIGKDGDDLLVGFRFRDYLSGGGGNDTLAGGGGRDTLSGGDGNDFLRGGTWADNMSGGGAADLIYAGGGHDVVSGGSGNDSAYGGWGADTLEGDEGDDLLVGKGQDDSLDGGGGDDDLRGGWGNDRLYGRDGADVMRGWSGDDYFNGDLGADRAFGAAGDDRFFMGEGADVAFGGVGADTFNSGGGNDREYGGAGDDYFVDSDGDDRMWGGAGADEFEFSDTEFGQDRIKDFEVGVDLLDMGNLARSLSLAGANPISITDTAAGTRFEVDAANWVLVEGVALADFADGDYVVTDPFAVV